jgi:hypothetical protein
VVGIFPNEDAIVRLIDALLLEQNDESAVMTLENTRPRTAVLRVFPICSRLSVWISLLMVAK